MWRFYTCTNRFKGRIIIVSWNVHHRLMSWLETSHVMIVNHFMWWLVNVFREESESFHVTVLSSTHVTITIISCDDYTCVGLSYSNVGKSYTVEHLMWRFLIFSCDDDFSDWFIITIFNHHMRRSLFFGQTSHVMIFFLSDD